MVTIDLKSWGEFSSALRTVTEEHAALATGYGPAPPLFRGMGDARWKLETTLERAAKLELKLEVNGFHDYYMYAQAAQPAIESFTHQQWDGMPELGDFMEALVSVKDKGPVSFFNNQISTYRYFLYLRHHGFPSPLLDWTASPYIAAFFAFDGMTEEANAVSIFVILRHVISVSSTDQPQVTVLGPYVRAHRRHVIQQSQYTICTKWAESFRIHNHDSVLSSSDAAIKITIPAAERIAALKTLDLMNINAYSLFGSEDSLMRTISRREGLFKYC
jgi:hypothetical protein